MGISCNCFNVGVTLMLVLYSLFCKANPPDHKFHQISIEQRLPGANVHCVYQDSKGLMWFAIGSVGLCKYDGENFTIYDRSDTDSNTISNNFPLCIVEDKTGHLWIGTTEGLNEYDREKGIFKRYLYSSTSDNCIPNNYIMDLHVDSYNNIWIGTRKGISKYNKNQDKFYNLLTGEGKEPYSKATMISTFYEDENENIWIGTYSNGLFLIDQEINLNHSNDNRNKLTISKHWIPIDKNYRFSENYAVQQICKYNENTLLIGKIDGLYLFDRKTEVFTKYPIHINPLIERSNISTLCKDNRGIIWAGYATEGIILIDPANDNQIYFDAKNSLPEGLESNTIRDIYEDKSGLIWIATKFQGLYTYDKRQEMFNKYEYNAILDNSIKNNFILSLLEDSQNNIWIGTKRDGVFQFNPTSRKIKNYTFEFLMGNNRIECIVEDVFGTIWAGTENGIKRFDKNSSKFYSHTFDNYFIRCMVADKHGNLWIGTNTSGVFYYQASKGITERYKSMNEQEFFNNNDLGTRAITITSDSLLWISTFQNGLYKYNIQKDVLTHYLNDPEDSTSISNNMVRGVLMDNNGKIWIGTESGGLNVYNSQTNKFIRIGKINGLPPNTIKSILQDKNNNYWMGTQEGLFTINEKTGKFTLFNDIYGLKSNAFEVNAKCITKEGLLIFGGSEGLNVFSPKEVYKPENDALLIISSIKVYDKVIAEDISDYSEISISYNEKYISIGFALTDYSAPIKFKYRYKLENFDSDWINCGNRNYATYTALPPGKYTFKVMAANSDNVWIDKPLTVKLTITSPFWRKPFFIVGFVILILIIVIIIYFARLRFIRRNEIKLKKLVDIKTYNLLELNKELEIAKEKAEESDKLKSAFLANISHEIRTPINGIMGFTELLQMSELVSDKQKTYIDIIRKSSDRMLRIINDIIDISIIESGQIKVQKEQVYVNAIINDLFIFYKPYADAKGVKLIHKNELAFDDSILEADKGRITQVLSNLIDNALKITNSGQISFGYTKKPTAFEFFVKDTGKGIPNELTKTIFERFMQIEDAKSNFREGSGLGLSISRAIVETHEGKIWVDSMPGKGSTFYFTIPFSRKSRK